MKQRSLFSKHETFAIFKNPSPRKCGIQNVGEDRIQALTGGGGGDFTAVIFNSSRLPSRLMSQKTVGRRWTCSTQTNTRGESDLEKHEV